MALDERLLHLARKTGAQLAEAERQALLARAEYHTAVRRLHLAGASLREIAGALSLSHHRIQQIVGGAGGSWWRTAWRTRTRPRDAACTWCGRPPSEVQKLVAGPNIYICDQCVRDTERALQHPRPASPRALRGSRCSFCRRGGDTSRRVIRGVTASVCSECLQHCREFMNLSTSEANG